MECPLARNLGSVSDPAKRAFGDQQLVVQVGHRSINRRGAEEQH
jgi:hypothetical protein